MEISPLAALPPSLDATAVREPRVLAASLDALIVKLLLDEGGLAKGMGGEEGAWSATVIDVLAGQIGEKLQLGFGRMLLAQHSGVIDE